MSAITALAVVVALLLSLVAARSQDALRMPDPTLTPGAVASTDPAEVCARVSGLTYSKRHRVWADKRGTMAKYIQAGILPAGALARDYQDDDRVPVCLGGDNADPRNHWPQPWPEARIKDELDDEACRLVCAGRVDLATAQGWFLGDWRAQLYRVGR